METLSEFYFAARSAFPTLAEKTDRAFVKYWGEPPSEAGAYSWFGSVSTALNNEMQKGSFLSESETFFSFVCQAFQQGNPEVKNCIDVSLVENLFWQVRAEHRPRTEEPTSSLPVQRVSTSAAFVIGESVRPVSAWLAMHCIVENECTYTTT